MLNSNRILAKARQASNAKDTIADALETRQVKRRRSPRTISESVKRRRSPRQAISETVKRRRCTRQAIGGIASEVQQATSTALVLVYAIILRFVYPMQRGPYFCVADAISENIPMHTDSRPDRRLMGALIRMSCVSETWINYINQTGASDRYSLEQVQKMLLRKDGTHNTKGLLYRQTALAQQHAFTGQMSKNGSVVGALNTIGNEPTNLPLAKGLVKSERMEFIRSASVFSWVSG
jgi:hypothetical protein